MANLSLTVNPQKITVPANTQVHTLDFDELLGGAQRGTALIVLISGTSVQFNVYNELAVSASNSAALQSADNKFYLPIRRAERIRYQGGAGSEVFNITIVPEHG